ncbi:MAG: B12-binding domain-containing radical SAM protein [Thermoanaerobaculia bacterium]
MRVALLKPPSTGALGLDMLTFVEPLGLECVAGALAPDGHESIVVDLRIDGMDKGLAKTRDHEPEVVGLQCNFTTERYQALAVAKRIKQELPDACVVIGGHDASRQPAWFSDPAFDAIALGDGEDVFPPMVDALGRGADLEGAPGLILNTKNGQKHTGPPPARHHLDEMALPARHLIDEYADHYYLQFRRPMALLETARGCPFKCNFCSVWKFHESTYRQKSPERIVEELSQIKSPYVFITDDIFWLDVKRGEELAKAIKDSGIRKDFLVQTRTDIICKFPHLVEMWKELGYLTAFLGVEKVDDAGLDSVNKSNSAENNVRAIQILKELKVGYSCNFIVDPTWGREDFARLRDWMDEMATYNAGFTVLTPLPGTDLWDDAKKEVTTLDWHMYDLIHTVLPTKLPLEEFYEEFASLWSASRDIFFKHRGKARFYLQLAAGVATGKITPKAMRRGFDIARRLSNPDTFMEAHRDSPPETAVPAADEAAA